MTKPQIKFIKKHADAQLPSYETPEAAGADVRSVMTTTIPPQGRCLIKTGLQCDIPSGWEIQVRPRSGLAYKKGVTVLNAPGTIDSDYQGELGVILYNSGTEPFDVAVGDRIAQIVVAPVTQGDFVEAMSVSRDTDRGAGGFGSTGVA